ncbi:response regulator receiver protein [Methanoregula boonei 6A8]|jgi:CheY-like chemotaxis protein/DNA-binding PadR family transcriptional regulator|uniref:Response regulator receiver protein n=1 Tax=Methanoregula boonei (strain DSM 21154 / JCM 14090 / 6A8) TaxID=456442 RepID=A7I8I5_METB6|nr:response regulator [Methanoregula boonei]ABS56046.1 response regulator receiver protein [Methanoregula boonei 6A8]
MPKILVVDDEAIITMQLEERLHAMGYTVAGMAASGEDAIGKARRLSPDLILMDIVMPGKLNGIEAAEVICSELDIPVIFVTSYADDAIIEKAKKARPYGYIVKPFSELEIKAAIEVALFRKAAERESKQNAEAARAATPLQPATLPGTAPGAVQEAEYLALPEIKTVLLKDIFSGIVLFLYVDPQVKDPIFKFAIEAGIQKGGRTFFAYHQSVLQKYFLEEGRSGRLFSRRIKPGELFLLHSLIEKCTQTLPPAGSGGSLQVLFDFSDTGEFDDIVAVKNMILKYRETGVPITGIIAASMAGLDHERIRLLSEGIAKIIVSTGKDTMISFAHSTFPPESITVVPQATIEDVVKKLLEPVILSILEKPISGFDIVHEIHNRYKVLIPQARIYTYLYELQKNGYLEMKVSGKSKLYYPTESGKKYIRQRLIEFKFVFRHIMGEEPALPVKKE